MNSIMYNQLMKKVFFIFIIVSIVILLIFYNKTSSIEKAIKPVSEKLTSKITSLTKSSQPTQTFSYPTLFSIFAKNHSWTATLSAEHTYNNYRYRRCYSRAVDKF
jgi:Na+/proline symporter